MIKKRFLLKVLVCIFVSFLLISSLVSCNQIYEIFWPTAILEVINSSDYSIDNIYCIINGTSDSNSLINTPILPGKTKTIDKINRAVEEVKIVFENKVSGNYETDFKNYDKQILEIK
jgi:hypothetical protein